MLSRSRRGGPLAALAGLGIALAPSPAGAAAFALFEQGARGMGFAGAFTAQASDPSAIFHNAAGLGFLKGNRSTWRNINPHGPRGRSTPGAIAREHRRGMPTPSVLLPESASASSRVSDSTSLRPEDRSGRAPRLSRQFLAEGGAGASPPAPRSHTSLPTAFPSAGLDVRPIPLQRPREPVHPEGGDVAYRPVEPHPLR
jgi:hypothetical protein